MRRFGWKNKSQPSETIGWWKIKCNYCGENIVFILNPKTLRFHNNKRIRAFLKSYTAHKVVKQKG